MLTNLISYDKLHFLSPSFSPYLPFNSSGSLSVQEITRSWIMSESYMIPHENNEKLIQVEIDGPEFPDLIFKSMGALFVYRGDVQSFKASQLLK